MSTVISASRIYEYSPGRFEQQAYAGAIEFAPPWVTDPGVRLRVNGDPQQTAPATTGWGVCETGRGEGACRGTCCA